MLYRNIKQSAKAFFAIQVPNYRFVRIFIKNLIIKEIEGFMILKYERKLLIFLNILGVIAIFKHLKQISC